MTESTATAPRSTSLAGASWKTPKAIALGLIPLALLVAVMAAIFATDGGIGDRNAPPIETLSVQQVRLPEPGLIELEIVNDGPDDVTIAQVRVDDATGASDLFTILMGDQVEPRRQFIEQNALQVKNLDI